MKLQTALIIVPHPDDEINVAGQLIVTLSKLKVRTYVMYTTNGDANLKVGNKRLREAVNALSVLDIPRENIIFLGYANDWKDLQHIYNAPPDKEVVSRCGKTETNGLDGYEEYIFQRNGIHHKFTRNNLKYDMKHVIQEVKADLLVCNDFDCHPDHRATSLLFDEIIGELLKEDKDYRPIILKKFAYDSIWFGEKDYYKYPMGRTKQPAIKYYGNGFHELAAPQYHWSDRISFETDPKTRTKYIRKNILYHSAMQHKSTIAWYQMLRVINADMVYWWRPVDNVMFEAKIMVTSGDKKYLNDFMYFDSADVMNENEPISDNSRYAWIPDEKDKVKKIAINFEKETAIEQMVFFEDCNYNNHILNMIIEIDGIEKMQSGELKRDGSATIITINPRRTVSSVTIMIEKWTGNPALTEIEIYSKVPNLSELNFPIRPMSEKNRVKRRKSFGQRLELFWLNIRFLFKFKIKYEVSRRIK